MRMILRPTFIGLLIGALLSVGLLASDATAETNREKLDAWLRSQEAAGRIDAAKVEKIRAAIAEAEDPLEAAIREVDAGYRKAMDRLEADGEEAAIGPFEAIVASEKDRVIRAYAQYRLAETQLLLEEFEIGEKLLFEMLETGSIDAIAQDAQAYFLLGFAWAQLDKKIEALGLFHRFLRSYPDAPERYRSLAKQMLRELESEYRNPLLDVAGQMKSIQRLLKKARTGELTQERQEAVTKLLQRLIELAEQMEKSGSGSGGGGGGGGGGRAGGNNSNGPANDSSLPPGASNVGKLRRISRGKADEVWGDLKDKDREEAMQLLKERFPERYRELLEEYYKALSEGR